MPAALPQRRVAQAIVLAGAGVGVVAVVVALTLWFHYGTTVFFETIAAGISACF
jgi:flagellar biosynthesis/type III secretory pathway M-ring protein FliF/YscJ